MGQATFFDDEEPVPDWEEDNSALLRLANVVFADSGPPGVFDYRIPEEFSDIIVPGIRLNVPLGKSNRSVLAYCIGLEMRSVSDPGVRKKFKYLQSVVDYRSLLSEKMIRLAKWISEYYFCPLGQVLETILPSGVRAKAGTRVAKVFYVDEKAWKDLNDQPGLLKIPQKQLMVLEAVRKNPEVYTKLELMRTAKCSTSPIDSLLKLGLLKTKTQRRETEIEPISSSQVQPQKGHTLNPNQSKTLDAILNSLRKNEHKTFLLHGVTGSGKTEVYIRAIEETVRSERQAIVLVPEISLTPQTVSRFAGRFENVAVLHSHLTEAQRHREWTRIANGETEVVVGARSAVFAPVPRLGLIVIDEEHENSFKQDTSPRYHARDVARKRAEEESVPLILGSATPSMESWHDAQVGKSQYLEMPNRVMNRLLPDVCTIDLREQTPGRFKRGAIHYSLYNGMKTALQEGGQVILLLNRRGFSTHIQCPVCGEVVKCPDCDVTLTHHHAERIALCHYCDYQIPAPDRCPDCSFEGIRYAGTGTQKLEMEIKARFSEYPALRMDTDTMQGRGSHERALERFRNGEVKILFGTQMIAKGLDFPNVTLVGVINADTALHLPDFRAAERTFHLVTQVAGRTGRGQKGGRVIVQTYNPANPAILAAERHDYHRFVNGELPLREEHGYPPFSKMARFVVRGPDERKTGNYAQNLADLIRSELAKLKLGDRGRVLGPAPAPITKLRTLFRFHLHVHVPEDFLHPLLKPVLDRLTKNKEKDIQWIIDIDPLDML